MQDALEFIDLTVGTLPFGLRTKALDAFDENAAIPRAVENGDFSATRELVPEPPEVMMRVFLVGRLDRRVNADVAGIEALDQPLDHPAFARGVGPLDDDYDTSVGILQRVLQFEKAQMSRAQFLAVFLGRVRFRLVEIGKADGFAGGGDRHDAEAKTRPGRRASLWVNRRNGASLARSLGAP